MHSYIYLWFISVHHNSFRVPGSLGWKVYDADISPFSFSHLCCSQLEIFQRVHQIQQQKPSLSQESSGRQTGGHKKSAQKQGERGSMCAEMLGKMSGKGARSGEGDSQPLELPVKPPPLAPEKTPRASWELIDRKHSRPSPLLMLPFILFPFVSCFHWPVTLPLYAVFTSQDSSCTLCHPHITNNCCGF